MTRKQAAIDRAKLRAAVRRLGPEYVYYMLDDAIGLLPPARLRKIAGKYLDLEPLRPDAGSEAVASLGAVVKAFDRASRAGEYYESFMVDSRNCSQKSTGTIAWIAEFHRLLDRCLAEAKGGPLAAVRESFDLLLGLLDHCGYRRMPITDSGASRSPIPAEADHRFRSKPIAERMTG